jgi:hypothetical protein
MISSRPLPPLLLGKILFSPSDTVSKQVVRAHTYFRAHIHLGLIIESSPAGAALFRIDLPGRRPALFVFGPSKSWSERERGNAAAAGRAAYLPLPTLPRSRVEPFLHSLSARRRIMEKG